VATKEKLSALRSRSHWRIRRQRVQRDIEDAKRLHDQVSIPAQKDIKRYIGILNKALAWLQKMEESTPS
jgi:hypothetical protein